MKKKSKFSFKKVNGRINTICQADGFFISYNPCIFDTGGEETALVVESEGGGMFDCHYYILEGDWRKEYLAVIDKGYEACERLFLQHADKAGCTSDFPPRYYEAKEVL